MPTSRTTQSGRSARKPRVLSPVVAARDIPHRVRLLLCVHAGGRCEFDGCNTYLFEDSLTLTDGYFAEAAHIVAFREQGPRGTDANRPANINQLANLMLLCPTHHKLIDDHPADYTRSTLESYKTAHEDRIKHVTSLGPDRKTAVVVFKALIRGQMVGIPYHQIAEATAPRFPTTRQPFTIDLTGLPADDRAFYKTACTTIKRRVQDLFSPEGEAIKAAHVSIFAIGPMPLLMCLGRQLTNKVASDPYQRHRDTESWTWKMDGAPVKYRFRRMNRGHFKKVALVLSLSGTIRLRDLPADTRRSSAIYELTLNGMTPQTTFLQQKRDLDAFRAVYQEAIATILQTHGPLGTIDLFPAVPAPIAVLCGRELLPKVHPKLRVYDNDRDAGGFTFKLEV